ncbi:MAG: hypothetical protein F9K44_03585 [Hyphomicrobiaceae bacterium]|nr:MAG: hypothetical protein F9K44_03585 [Hyphomicrobiaceae bacterium]
MGKLLGMLVVFAGGMIALHSLSTFDAPVTSQAVTSPPTETLGPVPSPQPVTSEERRRIEQRANRRKSDERTDTREARAAPRLESLPNVAPESKFPGQQLRSAQSNARLALEARSEKRTPAHAELARAIQTHLTRVGCYAGPVSGVWSEASQRAMKDFNSRVNASLPVDQPDEVLLALVENYKDTACGCLAGESLVNGRCAPLRAPTQAQVRKTAPIVKEARKQVPAKRVEDAAPLPKTAQADEWKTIAKLPEQRRSKPYETARNAKPTAVLPPTVVATARQQIEQTKELERRNVDPSRMGLGVRPVPATTPQQPTLQAAPQPPVETAPRLASISPRPAIEAVENPQLKPNTRSAPVVERTAPSRYVRKLAPSPPVYYRTTSTTYGRYLRSGAIWRRHESNSR